MNNKTFNTRYTLPLAALLIAVVLFVSVNIFSNLFFKRARVDLTENKLYTLSEGTKNILADLKEPISLKFYYSKQLTAGLAGLNTYATRIEELLNSYVRLSKGKISLTVIDPEAFSNEEELAIGYGLQGVPVNESGTNFYFGLVATSSVDVEKVIPFFNQEREDFLEYDLTQMIYLLENPDKPRVALISSLPVGKPEMTHIQGQGDWQVFQQVHELFDVIPVDNQETTLPDNLDALLLVKPTDLNENLLYAIDQYVLKGGHVLAFLDNYSDIPFQNVAIRPESNESINRLLNAWGVNFVANKLVTDSKYAKQVWYNHNDRQQLISYPLWFDVPNSTMDHNSIVTGDLNNITFSTPGYFEKLDAKDDGITVLMHSSKDSMLIANTKVSEVQKNPGEFSSMYEVSNTEYPLAVSIHKELQSAFDARPSNETNVPLIAKSNEKSNIILVGDTDLLQDRFWLNTSNFLGQSVDTPISSNGYFLLNALDNLTGSNDLISVRKNGAFTRPFTTLEEIQKVAETKYRSKEQELAAKLQATEERLRMLSDHQTNGSDLILSKAQQEEVERFKQTNIEVRKELRSVQHELNRDIQSIEERLKLINILLVPLLIGLGGVLLHRHRKKMSHSV